MSLLDLRKANRGRLEPRAAILAAFAALAACQGSDPQPLELVSLDRFAGPGSLIDGGGASSIIGYTSSAGSLLPTLRLVRHDAASPDQVEPLGDVSFTAGGLVTRLRVTDETAALVVDGVVRIVDLSVPSLPTEEISVPGSVVDLAVGGRWLAAAVEGGLVLVHRDDPFTPYEQGAVSTPTALLATAGGFLAFTTAGFVVVDTSGPGPTFQEVSDPVLRDLRAAAATADGSGAVVAGPGAALDRTRVLRLDLTSPVAPVVVQSCEVPGSFVALAWDGGARSVVAVHGDGDDARPDSFHQGYLVEGASDRFQHSGLPLPFWSQGGQPLAAHANRLFAVQAGGVALLRIR